MNYIIVIDSSKGRLYWTGHGWGNNPFSYMYRGTAERVATRLRSKYNDVLVISVYL
jgi:hypothetical protein